MTDSGGNLYNPRSSTTPRISGPGENSGIRLKPGHMYAAEKKVTLVPAFMLSGPLDQALNSAIGKTVFNIQDPAFGMQARGLDRIAGGHRKIEKINQHLQDSGAYPVRPP